MRFARTFPEDSDAVYVHLEGVTDSSTLCGDDTAGDDKTHRKQPEVFEAKTAIVTCPHCLEMISTVRDYLKTRR